MDASRYPVALSSWAVHKAVGFDVEDSPAEGPQPYRRVGPSPMDVRDLPAAAKAHGFERLELCHFHLDRSDPTVVDDLRAALRSAGVVLQSLLIDNGDLAHPTDADRDEAWIASWLETAAALGAERARVVGGRTRREGDVAAVAPRLRRLAANASVRVVTENWLDTLDDPDQVLRLLDGCEGEVGLNVDLGNWTGDECLDWIARIAGRAEVCHAKCEVRNGENDLEAFGRAIDAATRGGYVGPLTLVNGAGSDREWELVERQKAFVQSRPSASDV